MLCLDSLKGKYLIKKYWFCQKDKGRQTLLDVVIINHQRVNTICTELNVSQYWYYILEAHI